MKLTILISRIRRFSSISQNTTFNNTSLMVLDQYSGKPAGPRTIPYKGGRKKNQHLIDKGEKEAKEWLKKPTKPDNNGNPVILTDKDKIRREYYKKKYKYYHPSRDADNYSYIKPQPNFSM